MWNNCLVNQISFSDAHLCLKQNNACKTQGGASILEAVRGAEDITPMFESYHALANTSAIRKSLEKFEWLGKVTWD